MILFRCDATPRLGFGHLTRCRALAAALHELDQPCMMVGPSEACRQHGDEQLFAHWIALPWQDDGTADAIELARIAKIHQASAVVLDDMRVDERYQQVLLQAGLRWLQFDGARGHPVWADLIVNANPAADANYYRSHARKPQPTLLLGPAHAVLRPEFIAQAAMHDNVTDRRVLLMFGGGDDRGAIRFAIEALHPALPDDIAFDVVAGRQNPNHDAHRALLATLPPARAVYHVDPPALPALMQRCALAVMAGGTATYEANLFGLPMVLLAIADNQVAQSQAWDARGQAIYIGELESLAPQRLAQAALAQLALTGRPQRLVDGLGATRVATALLSVLNTETALA